MKIPLAEHFHSIMGEGFWVGTPMHFIRLAGCSVGHLQGLEGQRTPFLPTGRRAWQCHTWNNHPFWCDTDFNKREEVELSDLLSETWEDHVCLTGGEPLIHTKAIVEFIKWPKFIHIETSGTLSAPADCWLTVSPKLGYLPTIVQQSDELKLLISAETKDEWPLEFLDHPKVFLSPINRVEFGHTINAIDGDSLRRAQELLRNHPSWRLSVQLHKYLGLR